MVIVALPIMCGNNGNVYLDVNTNRCYTKTNCCWSENNCGNKILIGSSNPSNDLGCNGDYYLNTSTGAFFVKQRCILDLYRIY